MTNRNFVISILISTVLLLITGCGEIKKADIDETTLSKVNIETRRQRAQQVPVPAGGLVLSVESTAITAEEIIEPVKPQLNSLFNQVDSETFKQKAKPVFANILMQKITDIKLYEKAKAALPENLSDDVIDNLVEQEVQKFIARYGGNYATVEQLFKKMGTNWQDFRQQQRRAILVQSFISEEVKVEKPMTHSELLDHYNSVKDKFYSTDSTIEFRLIDLDMSKLTAPSDANISTEQAAVKLAEEIIQKINSGQDFAALAKEYSNDSSAKNGGLWKPVRPGSLIAPYDKIETAAQQLSVWQISEPIITDGHVFIVKLENKTPQGYQPFEQVQTEVEARYFLDRRQKMVNDMLAKIASQVDLSYADDFLEYCIDVAYQRIKQANNTN